MLKNLKKVAAIVLSFAMAVQFGLADSYYVNAVEEPVEPQQEETTTTAPQEQEEVPTAEEETPSTTGRTTTTCSRGRAAHARNKICRIKLCGRRWNSSS